MSTLDKKLAALACAALTSAVLLLGACKVIDDSAGTENTAAASLSGTTIITAIKPNDRYGAVAADAALTVTLTNTTVRTELVNTDVSSWFRTTVADLTYTATAEAGADTISIAVAGIPTAISSAADVQVTVPADALSGTGGAEIDAILAGTVSYSIVEAGLRDSCIKNNFGITTVGTDGVSDTFNAVHDYLLGKTAAELADEGIIRLGDYIDLEDGITVDGVTVADAPVTPNTPPFEGYDGRLLRLIVVGFNSFNAKGSYDGNGNGTGAHLVFQFQNLPFLHNMEDTNTNANGYAGSAMKSYITGPFLTGLIDAGVPGDILWAPTRYVANGGSGATDADLIEDQLWLPTVREMFGNNELTSNDDYETVENQARLEYYTGDALRVKYLDTGSGEDMYRLASPQFESSVLFGCVYIDGYSFLYGASSVGGCAPAFCVN
jgi:hypothetical protein